MFLKSAFQRPAPMSGAKTCSGRRLRKPLCSWPQIPQTSLLDASGQICSHRSQSCLIPQTPHLANQVGEHTEAIADYSVALSQSPLSPERLHFNRGILHDEIEDFDNALHDYSAAIQLDDSNPDFFNNRGITYRKQASSDHQE